jgi:chromosome segregation protein
VGLVTAAEGPQLHAVLLPGQRLVSLEGDLWRWDGFRSQAKDAPSAATLALEQRNRLQALQQELSSAQDTSEVAQSAHQTLVAQMQALAKADQEAREARRAADGMMADAGRAVSRAEAERNLAGGRVEALALAVTRHGEDAAGVDRSDRAPYEERRGGFETCARARNLASVTGASTSSSSSCSSHPALR